MLVSSFHLTQTRDTSSVEGHLNQCVGIIFWLVIVWKAQPLWVYYPWAGDPGLYKKTNWASYGE